MTTRDAEVTGAVMSGRFSCRAYDPRAVPQPVLEQLVTMARTSPSWCNVQPWEVVLTRGEATRALREGLKAQLATAAAPDLPFPETYTGAHLDRRRACGWALYDACGIKKGDREASAKQALRNFDFFDAPHVAILSSPASLGVYGVLDCGVYLGHFLLAAQSLGLGTIAQAAPAAYSPFLHEQLAIPPERQILCAIALGYPDMSDPANKFRTTRASVDENIRFVGGDRDVSAG
jgi:nitroreductase